MTDLPLLNNPYLVHDGDTIKDARTGRGIRLVGVNSPEIFNPVKRTPAQVGGEEAKRSLYDYLSKAGVDVTKLGTDTTGTRDVATISDASVNQARQLAGIPWSFGQESPELRNRISVARDQALQDYNAGVSTPVGDAYRKVPRLKYPGAELPKYIPSDTPHGLIPDALARGTDMLQGDLYGAGHWATRALENNTGLQLPNVKKWFKEGMDRNEQEAAQNPARYQSFHDVHGLGDAAKFAFEKGVESLPSTLPMIAGAALTGGAALAAPATVLGRLGKAIGPTMGAFAGNTVPLTGEIEQEQAKLKNPASTGEVLAGGMLNSALDTFAESKALSTMLGARKAKGVVDFAKQLGTSLGITVPIEGATEGLQELTSVALRAMHDPNFNPLTNPKDMAEAKSRISEAIVGGAAAGGLMGVGARGTGIALKHLDGDNEDGNRGKPDQTGQGTRGIHPSTGEQGGGTGGGAGRNGGAGADSRTGGDGAGSVSREVPPGGGDRVVGGALAAWQSALENHARVYLNRDKFASDEDWNAAVKQSRADITAAQQALEAASKVAPTTVQGGVTAPEGNAKVDYNAADNQAVKPSDMTVEEEQSQGAPLPKSNPPASEAPRTKDDILDELDALQAEIDNTGSTPDLEEQRQELQKELDALGSEPKEGEAKQAPTPTGALPSIHPSQAEHGDVGKQVSMKLDMTHTPTTPKHRKTIDRIFKTLFGDSKIDWPQVRITGMTPSKKGVTVKGRSWRKGDKPYSTIGIASELLESDDPLVSYIAAHEMGHALDDAHDISNAWQPKAESTVELVTLKHNLDLDAQEGKGDPHPIVRRVLGHLVKHIHEQGEVFSDALSIYLHHPELLRVYAPTAYSVLEDTLPRRPEAGAKVGGTQSQRPRLSDGLREPGEREEREAGDSEHQSGDGAEGSSTLASIHEEQDTENSDASYHGETRHGDEEVGDETIPQSKIDANEFNPPVYHGARDSNSTRPDIAGFTAASKSALPKHLKSISGKDSYVEITDEDGKPAYLAVHPGDTEEVARRSYDTLHELRQVGVKDGKSRWLVVERSRKTDRSTEAYTHEQLKAKFEEARRKVFSKEKDAEGNSKATAQDAKIHLVNAKGQKVAYDAPMIAKIGRVLSSMSEGKTSLNQLSTAFNTGLAALMDRTGLSLAPETLRMMGERVGGKVAKPSLVIGYQKGKGAVVYKRGVWSSGGVGTTPIISKTGKAGSKASGYEDPTFYLDEDYGEDTDRKSSDKETVEQVHTDAEGNETYHETMRGDKREKFAAEQRDSMQSEMPVEEAHKASATKEASSFRKKMPGDIHDPKNTTSAGVFSAIRKLADSLGMRTHFRMVDEYGAKELLKSKGLSVAARIALSEGKSAMAIFNDTSDKATKRVPILYLPNLGKSETEALSEAVHELGHLIKRAFMDQLIEKAATDPTSAKLVDSIFGKVDWSDPSQSRLADERFAEMTRKWALTKKVPVLEADKWFKALGAKLKELYNAVKDMFKGDARYRNFEAFMDALEGREKRKTPPKSFMGEKNAVAAAMYSRVQNLTNQQFTAQRSATAAPFYDYTSEEFLQSIARGTRAAARWSNRGPVVPLATKAVKELIGGVAPYVQATTQSLRDLGPIGRDLAQHWHILPGEQAPTTLKRKTVDMSSGSLKLKEDETSYETIEEETQRLMGSGIAEDLAKAFEGIPQATGLDYLSASKRKAAVQAHEDLANELLNHTLNRGTGALSDGAAGVTKFLDRFLRRFVEDGVYNLPIKRRQNYFPLVVDRDEASARSIEMTTLLMTHENMSANDANLFVTEVIRGNGVIDSARLSSNDKTFGAALQAGKSRELKLSTQQALADAGFYSKDIHTILHSYVKQMMKRAIEQNRFLDWQKDKNGEYVLNDQGHRVLNPMGVIDNALLNAERLANLKDPRGISATDIDRIRSQYLPGLRGQLGANINPTWSAVTSWTMTGLNVALLPLAVTSQFADLAGLAVARESYANPLGAFRDLKSMIGLLADKKQYEMMNGVARALGIVTNKTVDSLLSQSIASEYMTPTTGKINEKFFEFIQMRRWNDMMRTLGVHFAVQTLTEQAQRSANGQSLTNAKDMPIDRQELDQWYRNGAKPDDLVNYPTLQTFTQRWTDSAVLRPNASVRPPIMNDRRFALFSQLKGFMYSYYYTLMRRVWDQMGQQQGFARILPAVSIIAFTMPLAMAGYELRKAIAEEGAGAVLGRKPINRKPEGMDYVEEMFIRGGLLGPFTIIHDMYNADKHGSLALTAAMGPAFAKMVELMDKGYVDFLLHTTPLMAQSATLRDAAGDYFHLKTVTDKSSHMELP